MNNIRIPHQEMQAQLKRILIQHDFPEANAETCARIFTESSLDGVYSHGINRFPRFIEYIEKGFIDVHAVPRLVHSAGALEQWDGQLGPGPLNALACTRQAMKLADDFGLGCIAIANTNHWMRGGTYGWLAAKKGYAFIGWTNTEANMPAWGAGDSRLGNNPMVFAVPYKSEAVVLDFAMTQFSYGKMEEAHMNKKTLPFPGGFDDGGKLTVNPGEILKSRRPLPVGYWKGAGLSLLLDIMATILSAGLSTRKLSLQEAEYSVSQVFIAFKLEKLHHFPSIEKSISEIISDYKASIPNEDVHEIRYPGERALKVRAENLQKGIPVDASIWEKILSL